MNFYTAVQSRSVNLSMEVLDSRFDLDKCLAAALDSSFDASAHHTNDLMLRTHGYFPFKLTFHNSISTKLLNNFFCLLGISVKLLSFEHRTQPPVLLGDLAWIPGSWITGQGSHDGKSTNLRLLSNGLHDQLLTESRMKFTPASHKPCRHTNTLLIYKGTM